MTTRGLIAHGGPQRLPTRAAPPDSWRSLHVARGSPPWTPWTIRSRLDRPRHDHATYAYVSGVERRDPHAGLLPPVISVITITGIGDHLQPEWLITFTGMRNQWMAHINDRFQRRPKQVLLPIIPWLRHRVPQRK